MLFAAFTSRSSLPIELRFTNQLVPLVVFTCAEDLLIVLSKIVELILNAK